MMIFVPITYEQHYEILTDLHEEYFEWIYGQIWMNYQIGLPGLCGCLVWVFFIWYKDFF